MGYDLKFFVRGEGKHRFMTENLCLSGPGMVNCLGVKVRVREGKSQYLFPADLPAEMVP